MLHQEFRQKLLTDAYANLSSEIVTLPWSGPIGLAVGYELRKTVYENIPDPLVPHGAPRGFVPACADLSEDETKPFTKHPSFDEEIARDHPPATHRPWEQG